MGLCRNKKKDAPIIIVGCGDLGAGLIVATNGDRETCQNPADDSRLFIINSDGAIPRILNEAGAQNADVAVAITERDDDNIVSVKSVISYST